jgi:hypothetical protein
MMDGFGPRTNRERFKQSFTAANPERGKKAKRKGKGSGSGGRGGRH